MSIGPSLFNKGAPKVLYLGWFKKVKLLSRNFPDILPFENRALLILGDVKFLPRHVDPLGKS